MTELSSRLLAAADRLADAYPGSGKYSPVDEAVEKLREAASTIAGMRQAVAVIHEGFNDGVFVRSTARDEELHDDYEALLIQDRIKTAEINTLVSENRRLQAGASAATLLNKQHGVTCPKAPHIEDGQLHGEDDDTPFNVDGLTYCGRCHSFISR